MKKEHFLVIAVVLLLLASGLDYIAGNTFATVMTPFEILSPKILNQFPLTTTAIFVRVLGLYLGVLLVFSFFEKKYFTKAALCLFLGFIAEFYSIQQLSTGMRFTPIQWTLSFAYCGLLLFPTSIIYIFKGVYNFIRGAFSEPSKEEYPEPILDDEGNEDEDKKKEEVE